MISLLDRNGGKLSTLPLSGQGRFEFEGLNAGVYTIAIYDGATRIHQQRVELPGAPELLKIQLP